MEQFEYKLLDFKRKSVWSMQYDIEEATATLNEYGKKGWEAISSSYQPNGVLLVILKRKIN